MGAHMGCTSRQKVPLHSFSLHKQLPLADPKSKNRRAGPPVWEKTTSHYWLIATPLKEAMPIGLEVAASDRSP